MWHVTPFHAVNSIKSTDKCIFTYGLYISCPRWPQSSPYSRTSPLCHTHSLWKCNKNNTYGEYLSHRRQNKQNDVCAQRRLRSAWASAKSDQCLRCTLYELLRTQYFFMRAAKTLNRLGGCPGWSESSLGALVISLVLSCCDSYNNISIRDECIQVVFGSKK